VAIPDLVARIRLDTSDLSRGLVGVKAFGSAVSSSFTGAIRPVDDFGKRIQGLSTKSGAGLQTLGRTGLAVGAGIAAGFGVAVHSAIQFESAFAGVRKTVDATEPELDAIREGILDLAATTPAAATEIAAVAEAAGQLDVQKGAILDFSKTVIQLAETTNLTADEAATNLARFANIFQTPAKEINNLAAALVDLGNKGASTERDILELGTRLAAAGSQAGLSEADVLSFANALSSVGVEAEAGGTAFSKVFTNINDAVLDGGKRLDTFALVAGKSAKEFAEAYRRDPASAIEEFVAGLGQITDSGGSVTEILQTLGLSGERTKRALLSVAGAGDLLSESLGNGRAAYEAGRAAIDEYNKRLETTGAKLEIARNNLQNVAIRLGDAFLPAISGAADGVSDFVGALTDLPGPLGFISSGLLGVVGALAGVGGAFLLVAPRISAAKDALEDLGKVAPRAAGALGALGKAGLIGAAVAGLAVVINVLGKEIEKLRQGETTVGDVAKALLDLSEGGKAAEGAFERLDKAAAGKQGNLKRYIDELNNLGPERADDVDAFAQRVEDALEGVDEALVQILQTGGADAAREALGAFADAAGVSVQEVLPFLDQYNGALRDSDNAERAAGEGAEALAGNLGNTAQSADEAKEKLQDFEQQLQNLLDETFSVDEATRNFEQAIDDLTASTLENGKTFDAGTQAGRDNAAALQEVGESALGVIQANRELGVIGNDLNAVIATQRLRFIAAALAAGKEKGEAEALADSLFAIPKEVTTDIKVDAQGARDRIQEVIDKLKELPPSRTVRVEIEELQKERIVIGKNLALRQHGGPVYRGTPYIVGEAGPEIFVPDLSGRILPNGRQAASAQSVQNANNTYNQQVVVNEHVSPKKVAEEMHWLVRTSGV